MKIQIVFFYIHQSHVLAFILQYIQCILLDLRIQSLKTSASLMRGIAINIKRFIFIVQKQATISKELGINANCKAHIAAAFG